MTPEALNHAINLWLASGLLAMSKKRKPVGGRQAASKRAFFATQKMYTDNLDKKITRVLADAVILAQAAQEAAARQESQENEFDRAWDHYPR